MTPFYERGGITIYCGDNRDILPDLDAESIHACVTDPPYGLSFMGKGWDHGVPGVEFWTNVLRVLKPGGHLLAFGGTRTYHRLAVAIEDAGFEVRDCIMWVYGSGFPKSLDVGKAIDKAAGAEREVVGKAARPSGLHRGKIADYSPQNADDFEPNITAPATEAAKQWDGWGTALKPSYEPIIVARKPLEGTVAANVLKHGCGGINVDGCRIGTEEARPLLKNSGKADPRGEGFSGKFGSESIGTTTQGRWPANLIHDGSEEVLKGFPETESGAGGQPQTAQRSGNSGLVGLNAAGVKGHADSGSAARFFYTAKADKSDRGHGNNHPTVKPLDLMRYLVRLVCPAGGIVIDPFFGSGTTIVAAREEHSKAIGCELSEDYCRIAVERLRQGVFSFGED